MSFPRGLGSMGCSLMKIHYLAHMHKICSSLPVLLVLRELVFWDNLRRFLLRRSRWEFKSGD